MPQFTLNCKAQDAKTLSYYGILVQYFFKAFGKDELEEIGCYTLINQQDFLGVNLIAIQALEKRTACMDEMKNQILELQKENVKLQNDVIRLMQDIKNK